MYYMLELEEREVEAFDEVYQIKDNHDSRFRDLKNKEKDLEVELMKLNTGKQGVFSSLFGKVEDKKAKTQIDL